MNWVDYLLLSLIIITGIIGYNKGLLGVIKSLLRLTLLYVTSAFIAIQLGEFIFGRTTIGHSIALFMDKILVQSNITGNSVNNLTLLQNDIIGTAYVKYINTLTTISLNTISFTEFLAYFIVHIAIIVILMLALAIITSSIIEGIKEHFSIDDNKNKSYKIPGAVLSIFASASIYFLVLKLHLDSIVIHLDNGYTTDILGSQIATLIQTFFT